MIKAIIFDMDGVLIEAKDWHYQALNKALGLFGMEISYYDHLSTFDGLPTKTKLKMLSLERGLPELLHDFIAQMKQQYTMEMVHAFCKPKFHHEFALSRLRGDGYLMAVCSNSIRHSIEVMMQKSALDGYFEFYLSNEDVKEPKPSPEIYNKAIQKLGFHPKEVLIIEDNENGIQAAKKSGAHVMRVGEVSEVNYTNIKSFINQINNLQKSAEFGGDVEFIRASCGGSVQEAGMFGETNASKRENKELQGGKGLERGLERNPHKSKENQGHTKEGLC